MNEKKNDVYEPFRTVVCEKCGQVFIPAPMHIFKENGKWYCKWSCWEHRKDKPKKT